MMEQLQFIVNMTHFLFHSEKLFGGSFALSHVTESKSSLHLHVTMESVVTHLVYNLSTIPESSSHTSHSTPLLRPK